jgi:hypothetical protein
MTETHMITDLHLDLLADPIKLKPLEQVLDLPKPLDIRTDDSHMVNKRNYDSPESPKLERVLSERSRTPSPYNSPIKQSPPAEEPVIQNIAPVFPTIQLDEKTIKFKKMELLAKLYDIQKCGKVLTKSYNINSDLDELEMEVKFQTDIENRRNGVNLCKSFLINTVTAIEFLNDKFDPFGLQLKGWSEQMKINSENYDEVFTELYEKYKQSGRKMEPEIKLILMIGASAASFHATKSMTNSIGLDNIVKNNPSLIQKLQGSLSNIVEKKIGGKEEDVIKKPEISQQELYKKMMKEKVASTQQPELAPIKKPNISPASKEIVSNLLSKLKKAKIDSDSSNRIKVTDTLDSDTVSTEIDISKVKKMRRKRSIL